MVAVMRLGGVLEHLQGMPCMSASVKLSEPLHPQNWHFDCMQPQNRIPCQEIPLTGDLPQQVPPPRSGSRGGKPPCKGGFPPLSRASALTSMQSGTSLSGERPACVRPSEEETRGQKW